ncbi:MAG: acetoacetate decarboxylase [Bacteroidia bacterium]
MSNFDFKGTCLDVESAAYAVPPYQYRDNEMFTLKIEVDPAYLRALVPAPMQVNADNIMAIYVGWLHVVEPKKITYGEAGIMIPVSLGDRVGTYMPVLYLDEVELLTAGREVWGFPKFRGEVAFERSENAVRASVSEGDVVLIDMQMDFEKQGESVPVYDREHFLLKSIPSVTGDGYDVRQINSCKVRNDHRKEIWEGQAELNLRSTPTSPLGDIPVTRIISSVYTVGDIVLDKGEVIYRYGSGQ